MMGRRLLDGSHLLSQPNYYDRCALFGQSHRNGSFFGASEQNHRVNSICVFRAYLIGVRLDVANWSRVARSKDSGEH